MAAVAKNRKKGVFFFKKQKKKTYKTLKSHLLSIVTLMKWWSSFRIIFDYPLYQPWWPAQRELVLHWILWKILLKNLVMWNCSLNQKQTVVKWSLCGPISELYPMWPGLPTKVATTAKPCLTLDHLGNPFRIILIWNNLLSWNQVLLLYPLTRMASKANLSLTLESMGT